MLLLLTSNQTAVILITQCFSGRAGHVVPYVIEEHVMPRYVLLCSPAEGIALLYLSYHTFVLATNYRMIILLSISSSSNAYCILIIKLFSLSLSPSDASDQCLSKFTLAKHYNCRWCYDRHYKRYHVIRSFLFLCSFFLFFVEI